MKRRVPRLKWHMLRRRKSDPGHLRANLEAALRAGAACEVDLQFTSDGHAFCLHDAKLDRETTGKGPATSMSRAQVEALRQRTVDGTPIDSAPLFLDEVADAVRRFGRPDGGLVQLDVKAPVAVLDEAALDRMAQTMGDVANRFVAGACDWQMPVRLAKAIAGLQAGFDPLDFYPRTMPVGADAFRVLGARTVATAPDASIYYLEANLVLAGLRAGVNLIETVRAKSGAEVDVWTIDADRPGLRDLLATLVDAGCTQVTSNDPDILQPILEDIVACS
jgi:glycerophosphoryl diester phosphodiesterase